MWTIKGCALIYLIVFVIMPVIFHYSYCLQRKILFLNFVYWPFKTDFSDPKSAGLEGARNFYLSTDQQVKLGAWQILPRSLIDNSSSMTDEDFEAALSNAKRPVFLYMHGNSGHRASLHRLELYKLFQDMDYHIICFDYRSYGDSDAADLSEEGVVSDSKYVVEWLLKKVNGSAPIFVWGHSLGTGVSTHVLALLAAENIQPTGLFLEAPFNNIADELTEHPLSQVFKHLPWFHWMIVEPFYKNNLRFESDKHISNIECPIMILHAEDDGVIPFFLAEKLYQAALNQKNVTKEIEMVRIKSSYGLGHKYICRYKELPDIIQRFIAKAH